MNTFKILAILIYLIGIPLWALLWRQLIGFDWLKKIPKLNITFYGGALLLFGKMVTAYFADVPEYGTELGLTIVVERNAITVVGLSLAIATFIIVTFSRVSTVEQDEKMHLFLN
jgi:hypothetical protein